MSNVDTLLDFGDEGSAQSPPAAEPTQGAATSDPFDMFDPFAMPGDSQVNNSNAEGVNSTFDSFDPFASLTPKTSVTMTTDLSESDQKALESEFDDLLGDFSGSNGPQQNGEVITTVTKTSTDGDKVTTVTTKEVVSSKSYDAPQVETELLHVDTAPSGGGSRDHSSLSPLDDAHSNNIMSHSVTLSMSPPPELLASTTDPFSEGAGDFPDHMGVAPQAEEEGLDDEETNDVSMEDEEAEMERDGDEVEEEEEEEEENSEESVQHIPLKEPQTESVPHEDTMDSLVNAGEEVQKEETPADGEDAKEYQDEDVDDEGEKEAAEDYAQNQTRPNQTEELDQEKTTMEETEELDTDDTEQQHRNLNLNPEGFDNEGLDQDDEEEKACAGEEEDLPPNTSQQILEDSRQHDGKEAGDDAVFDGDVKSPNDTSWKADSITHQPAKKTTAQNSSPTRSYNSQNRTSSSSSGNRDAYVTEDSSREVFRAEDPVEENLEQLPSINNLKSRFELHNDIPEPPAEQERRRSSGGSTRKWQISGGSTEVKVNGIAGGHEDQEAYNDDQQEPPYMENDREIVRETEEKEEIRFEQMQSVRSMFEEQSREVDYVPAPSPTRKTSSKWDKPQQQQQPEANRTEEYYEEDGYEPQQDPPDMDRDGDREVVRETHEKEEIRFEQMQSVRSMFEDSSREQNYVPAPSSPAKKTSKWDKPKTSAPPPVNRVSDQIDGDQYEVSESYEAQQEAPGHIEQEVAQETQNKEEIVHFEQIHSVRSMFEESSRNAPAPAPSSAQTKKTTTTSKWDKPKTQAPPPVNREVYADEEGEPFEVVDHFEAQQSAPDHSEITRENQDKEEVIHFEQIHSVRSMFEESSRDAPAPAPSPAQTKKTTSKWDKPKTTAPPPVNRVSEDQQQQQQYRDDEQYAEQQEQDESYVEDDRDIVRETREKEEIHFEQLHSVRSMFEEQSRNAEQVPSPSSGKKPSKWDKPKGPPPPPVNRPAQDDQEQEYEDEQQRYQEQVSDMPETPITQNLVAKFRELEQTPRDEPPPAELKPIRKMTPPREEVRQDVEAYLQQQEIERDPNVVRYDETPDIEKELPPPEYTKSVLQKFRSMENVNAQPPTPQRSVVVSSTRKKTISQSSHSSRDADSSHGGTPEVVNRRGSDGEQQYIEPEVEGGVYENEPLQSPEVVRESDRHYEEELPEQGLAKNLLAKWQTKLQEEEQQVRSSPPKKSPTPASQSWSYKQHAKPATPSQSVPVVRPYADPEDVEENGEIRPEYEPQVEAGVFENEPVYQDDVVRERNGHEEDELPPPSFTKNLLAKFQTLEAEAEREATTVKPPEKKKEFKWQVKEARPLSRPLDKNFDYHPEYDERDRHATYSYDQELSMEEREERERRILSEDYQGEYEYDDNVVRADAPVETEEELPPENYAKSVLAKFRSMEDVSQPPPSPNRAASSTPSSGSRHNSSGHGQSRGQEQVQYDIDYERDESYQEHDPEVFEQYRGEAEAGEFENEPERDPDIVREEDRFDQEELPEQGTTQSLLAKWKSMQS